MKSVVDFRFIVECVVRPLTSENEAALLGEEGRSRKHGSVEFDGRERGAWGLQWPGRVSGRTERGQFSSPRPVGLGRWGGSGSEGDKLPERNRQVTAHLFVASSTRRRLGEKKKKQRQCHSTPNSTEPFHWSLRKY